MAQTFCPQPSEQKQQLCCYFNASKEIVIARITDGLGKNYERVVFPMERFLFEASAEAYLEIHQYTQTGIHKNVFPSTELQVSERVTQAQ
jgi:Domain of unknown function (DUF1830)